MIRSLPGFLRRSIVDPEIREKAVQAAEEMLRADAAGDRAGAAKSANNLKQIAIAAHGAAMSHADAYFVVVAAETVSEAN